MTFIPLKSLRGAVVALSAFAAFAAQAHWLLSKDRAVLRLAGRAARLGLRIATPARWNPADEGGSAPAGSANRREYSPRPSG